MKQITRNLRVYLTDEERSNLQTQIVEISIQRMEAEGKLASISAEYKGTIKAKNAESDRLIKLVHQGYDYRDVDCEEQRDESSKEIVIYRSDNWEEVARRPMSIDETQMDLKFAGVNPPDGETSEGSIADFFTSNEAAKEAMTDEDSDDSVDRAETESAPEPDVADASEFDPHPQCNAKGGYLESRATKREIAFPADSEFQAVIKTIRDSRDGLWRAGYRCANTVKPSFRMISPFSPENEGHESESLAIISACFDLIENLRASDKFPFIRGVDIVAVIEQFQSEQLVAV